MATAKKTTTRAARKTSATNGKTKTSSGDVNGAELRDRILTAIQRRYKLKLATRDERVATKVGHAVREKLGKDIQSKVKNFDWKEWNTKIFPKILGSPDALKYPVEIVADAIALLYDSVSEETNKAIVDLVEFNAASLKRRNELAKAQEEEEDDLDDLDDEDDEDDVNELLDEVEDEDDEEDDFDDEDEDEDEEDFELDDEDE